ncbi:NAD(P)-dependent alcohol dehydrogenase [Nocardia sp. NPDC050710]|uniref:NAD(P)-dependent alcohol dehydrogenase n=1 Tax=Nocardia sp. NPDC050710 TaxID=3157220 RepID=UPI0033D0B3B3
MSEAESSPVTAGSAPPAGSGGRAMMTAVVAPQYGGSEVLRVESAPRPAPGKREVLVRVRAAAVCKGDVHLLTGTPYLIRLMGFGVRRPKHRVIGHDLAGEVVAVGADVTDFRPGDAVFGSVTAGAFAEYVRVPVDTVAPVPAGLSFEQVAAVPDSGMTALQGLREVGQLRAGQRVLINGASGGVGSFAVQIAKALGAEVTAVCSTRHLDMVRGLGADHVIDYTAADFTEIDRRFDVLLDLVGNRPLAACRRILTPTGIFVSSSGAPGGNWFGPVLWLGKVVLANLFVRQTLRPLLMRPRRADLEFLTELLENGAVRPSIERSYPLVEAAAAIRHIENGHAEGKTVLVV